MHRVHSATKALRRLIGQVAESVRELTYWQRRATVLWMAPDRLLPNSNQPPDTYGEFLSRTWAR